MFKTTEQYELLGGPRGADGIQFWSLIEHEILWPWYYIQVVQDLGTELSRTMLMMSTTSELSGVALARTKVAWLEAAYIATPGDINGTGAWTLEPLVEVLMYRDGGGAPTGVIHRVVSGETYALGDPPDDSRRSPETVFDATLHLGPFSEK